MLRFLEQNQAWPGRDSYIKSAGMFVAEGIVG